MPSEIPPLLLDYRDALLIPRGHHLDWAGNWGWFLVRADTTASFRLTDRTFGDVDKTPHGEQPSDIDYWVGGALSQSIEHVLERKEKCRVLDIACGPLARAAYDLGEHYGDVVSVHALDSVGSKLRRRSARVHSIIGNALQLPYRDAQFDVVYSFQLFPHLPEQERARGLEEVLRVMAGGGHAVLDILETVGFTNGWINEYQSEDMKCVAEFFPWFNSPLFSQPWTYTATQGTFHFRPVTEYKQTAPGFFALNDEPTRFLHITKH